MSENPDGTINVYDESLFEAGGKLYADFDATALTPVTGAETAEIPNDLYQINPLTGRATLLGPLALGLAPVVDMNGTVYAFDTVNSEVVTLNLTNRSTNVVSDFDPALIPILGASPVPESASLVLGTVG